MKRIALLRSRCFPAHSNCFSISAWRLKSSPAKEHYLRSRHGFTTIYTRRLKSTSARKSPSDVRKTAACLRSRRRSWSMFPRAGIGENRSRRAA